jgi:O-antigen ligase
VPAAPTVTSAPAARTQDAASTIAFFAVAATSIVLPLIVDLHGDDSFRLPKELAFRAGAIAVIVAFIFALTRRRNPLRINLALLRRAPIAIPLVAVLWTAITTLTSVNRAVSVDSLVTVICSAALFIGTYAVMRGERLIALDVALIPALVNAALVMLQEYKIWQPFAFPPEAAGHMSSSALIGNPNDVGAYLVVPAVAAAVGTVATRGLRRAMYSIIAVVLLAGLVASGTRTAVIAYGIALFVFAIRRSFRNAIIIAVLLLAAGLAALSPLTRLGRSVRSLITAAKERRYDILLSNRIPPFLCAIEMWREHPIAGGGPGTYKIRYMEVKETLRHTPQAKWLKGSVEFFGIAHNDHLQLLAEGGLSAEAIFLVGLVILVAPWLRRLDANAAGAERLFARELRLPLALTILVLPLAGFPLQIAAPRLVILYFSALCLSWDDHHAS